VSGVAIDPLVPDLQQIQIVWPTGLTRTNHYAAIIAWSLRNFYVPTDEEPAAQELVAGLISYLNCLLPAEAVEGRGQLIPALAYVGLVPVWREATPRNLADFRTVETLRFMRLFGPGEQHLFVHDRRQQLGLLGVLLLLIGRSVTSAGYTGWINNRLRTFRGVLGIMEDHFIWTTNTCPAQRMLATLSTYLSANQPLRTRLFQVCLRASMSRPDITTQILSTVVKLLRGVEMGHILLIDYYLFNKYPEILRVRAIRDDLVKYNQALNYLAFLTPYERLYVKLMRPREETSVLNRNNFVMLSTAAFAAAKIELPSMRNYIGAASGYNISHCEN
jgi:hypothetical protein